MNQYPTPFAHHATTISSQTFWTSGMATASTLMHPYWSSIPKCIDTIVQPYFTRKSWTYIQDEGTLLTLHLFSTPLHHPSTIFISSSLQACLMHFLMHLATPDRVVAPLHKL
jgi:hypothetical protein